MSIQQECSAYVSLGLFLQQLPHSCPSGHAPRARPAGAAQDLKCLRLQARFEAVHCYVGTACSRRPDAVC